MPLQDLPQIKALVNHPVLDIETKLFYAMRHKVWVTLLDYGTGKTKPPANFTGDYIDYVGEL